MSIVSLQQALLTVGGKRLLDQVDWQIEAQDRIALVGRNGAGKSSLLKLLQGQYHLDSGQLQFQSGLRVAGLSQDVPFQEQSLVYEVLVQGLGEAGQVLLDYHIALQANDEAGLSQSQQRMDRLHCWELMPKIAAMAQRLGVDMLAKLSDLSGGLKRRALLAAALLAEPDLLLLDEPTNHLDLPSIEWLESWLKSWHGSLLLVSHDRAFLDQVSTQIVEIDRGKLFTYRCNYPTFIQRRDDRLLAESQHHALFDKKLAEEETWIRTGIKARRTRNEGRVRALKAMRQQRLARQEKVGKMQQFELEVGQSGALVLEAKNLCYNLPDRSLIQNFNLLLAKGDKLGLIGPNGSGKTTLIRLLLGELAPQSGRIKRGKQLEIAYFDQLRRQLDDNQTLMANVGEGADYVTINGQQKHVSTYLRDFLFAPEQFNQTVDQLSGGERNRLLLAKLFAKPVNFLVMDEPTNDLDIETLELLEAMLVDYPGTLIIISHDRAFINAVVTSLLVYEGEGQFNEYVGGYEDYLRVKKSAPAPKTTSASTPAPAKVNNRPKVKLSFNEQRELDQLPKKIEQLETQIGILQNAMLEPNFYQQDAACIATHNQQLAAAEQQLGECFARWEDLESKS